jgi:hypothetical protein
MGNKYKMIIIKSTIESGAFRCLVAAGALAIVAASQSIAAPPVTFASYGETNSDLDQWTISTTTCTVSSTCTNGLTTTTTASGSVQFEFSGVPGAPMGELTAELTLSATSYAIGNCGGVVSPACSNGDSYGQPGYAGMFSIIDSSLPTGEQNLLSGIFAVTGTPATTGAQFSSNIGSTGGSFNASSTATNLLQLALSSSYLNFSGLTEDASFSYSSLNPEFAIGSVSNTTQAFPAMGSSVASGTGTFSSSLLPTPTPEPVTFALIGGGLIVLGVMRRRKAVRS